MPFDPKPRTNLAWNEVSQGKCTISLWFTESWIWFFSPITPHLLMTQIRIYSCSYPLLSTWYRTSRAKQISNMPRRVLPFPASKGTAGGQTPHMEMQLESRYFSEWPAILLFHSWQPTYYIISQLGRIWRNYPRHRIQWLIYHTVVRNSLCSLSVLIKLSQDGVQAGPQRQGEHVN